MTGASRGIGAATAQALGAAGARVVLAARDAEALETVARGINEAGGDALATRCDVGKPEEVEQLFATVARVGPLAALVCAAAVLTPASFEQTTRELWSRPSPSI